jgi:hypothetical protein
VPDPRSQLLHDLEQAQRGNARLTPAAELEHAGQMESIKVPKALRSVANGLIDEELARWVKRGVLAPLSKAVNPSRHRPLFTSQWVPDPDGVWGLGVVSCTSRYSATVLFQVEERVRTRVVPHDGSNFSCEEKAE